MSSLSKQEEKDEDFQAPPEQDKDSNTTADDEVQVGNTEDEDKVATESDPESDHRNDRDFSDDGDPDLDTPSYSQEETGGSDFDETESITDSALQESLSRLISDDAKEWIYLDLPQFNYRDFTEDDDIQKDLESGLIVVLMDLLILTTTITFKKCYA